MLNTQLRPTTHTFLALVTMLGFLLSLAPSQLWGEDAKGLRRRGSTEKARNPLRLDRPPLKVRAAFPSLVEPVLKQSFALDRATVESCFGTEGKPLEEVQCQELPGGIAHIAAGTGLRNAGFGSIRLRGAPAGSVPVAAWLYFSLLDQNPAQRQTVFFESQAVEASLLATPPQPCWDDIVSAERFTAALYRASVLPLITKRINGDYQIAGIPSSTTDGSDPFLLDENLPLAQGASLVVVFSNQGLSDDSRVYIHEDRKGIPLLNSKLIIGHTLQPPLPPWSQLSFTSIGGDGQVRDLGEPLPPFITDLIGPGGELRIRGQGSVTDAYSDWGGCDGGSVSYLWDTTTTVIEWDTAMIADDEETQNSILPPGSSEYKILYGAPVDASLFRKPQGFDCVNVLVHILGTTN